MWTVSDKQNQMLDVIKKSWQSKKILKYKCPINTMIHSFAKAQTIMTLTWRNWPSSGGWFLGWLPLHRLWLLHLSPTWLDRLLCLLLLNRRGMMKHREFRIYSCCLRGLLCPCVSPSLWLSLATLPSAPESTVSLCPESHSQMSAACVRAECRWAGGHLDLKLSLLLLPLLVYPLQAQWLLQSLSPQSWCPGCGWRAQSQVCYSVSGPGRPL